MKFLVAGSLGFIASHLVWQLEGEGHSVTGYDLKMLRDAFSINDNLVSHYDAIFNCAALPRMQFVKENPEETLKANVQLVAHLAKLCKVANVPLIHCSSSSVYGFGHSGHGVFEEEYPMPANSYGFQKALAESIIQDIQPNAALLRFFNVYGEGQPDDSPYTGVITKFLKQHREGKPLTVFGDGSQQRDYTYVKDIVRGMIKAYEYVSKNPGVHTFNLGSGKPFSVKELAEAVGGELEFLPAREGDVPRTKAVITKARKDLGWEPSDMTPITYIKSQL